MNFGNSKLGADEKISLAISDGKQSFAAEADESGKFSFANVTPGKYIVTVTLYKSGSGKTPPGPPDIRTYPEDWTVPGGPYTIDMAKLAPAKK